MANSHIGGLNDRSGSFRDRVRALHDSWQERREVRPLAASGDLESQRALLSVLHGWAQDAARVVRDIYANDLPLRVDDAPSGEPPSFSVSFGAQLTLTFFVREKRAGSPTSWTISAHLLQVDAESSATASPPRRNGQWSRARMEEVFLSALGMYERASATESSDNRVRSLVAARRLLGRRE